MSSASERRAALRRRIGTGPMLVVPGAGDGLGARLAQAAGFEAVYMSGYYVEGTFGQADVGLLGMSEMAARAAQICDATDLPVLADADTGYGNAVNVIRTVRAFERAGVAALQLEDQELPKKCGSFPRAQIVDTMQAAPQVPRRRYAVIAALARAGESHTASFPEGMKNPAQLGEIGGAALR